MSRSAAEGLRMMQGGVDRTGFADMYESLGDPLAKIKANRAAADEESAMAAALEEYENRQAKSDQDFVDLLEGLLPPEEEELPTFREKYIDPLFPEPKEGPFEIDPEYKKPRIQGPGRGVELSEGGLTRDEKEFQQRSNYGIGAILEQMYESGVNSLPYLYDLLGVSGFEDGGRVEAFSGGVMNNLLGSSQMQNMMQQQGLQNQIYQQPTIGFQPMPNPGDFDFVPLPDPRMGTGTPPPATAQAYNPFVSNMPLYDPSTLGTGLPSTAGMTDPYFSYDPYSAAGAFDAPPANIGGFLSRKEIEDTFKDLDKFSLRAQEAKRKAAEEADKKKETRRGERDGGQGGGGDRGTNSTGGSGSGTGSRGPGGAGGRAKGGKY